VNEYLLECRGITKTFDRKRVIGLNRVDFTVRYGEVVGLVGDNGAGKSTLIKIISGVHVPDEGDMYVKGERVNLRKHSVSKSRQLGIETVYQEKALVEQQTLWRNIFIGREMTDGLGFLQIKKQEEETQRLMTEIGYTSRAVLPDSVIRMFSGGEKQGVAIARALHFGADLIILDEPTTALSISEAKKVLDFVRTIGDGGKSCVLVTHNIYHVHMVADRFVILDRGRNLGEFQKQDISLDDLIESLHRVAETGQLN
jgi:simple sugar transport system ATP-binding protein